MKIQNKIIHSKLLTTNAFVISGYSVCARSICGWIFGSSRNVSCCGWHWNQRCSCLGASITSNANICAGSKLFLRTTSNTTTPLIPVPTTTENDLATTTDSSTDAPCIGGTRSYKRVCCKFFWTINILHHFTTVFYLFLTWKSIDLFYRIILIQYLCNMNQ